MQVGDEGERAALQTLHKTDITCGEQTPLVCPCQPSAILAGTRSGLLVWPTVSRLGM